LTGLHIFLQADENTEEEWYEDDEVPDELRSKVFALKVVRNRCLTHGSSNRALEIATPLLKLLATLIEFEGSVNGEVEEE
jgi:sister-chromatid-cohesion protein PDS5